MRFLKTLTLNRRTIYDDRVALTTDNSFTLATSNNVVLPNSEDVISTPVVGMMRYNTATDQVEVYQGDPATWRAIRYKESTGIVQQQLAYGDAMTVYFGPLTPAPPSIVQSNTVWGGQNLIVVIENVIQLHTTNYLIEQNPTITGISYEDNLSADSLTGASVLNFDPNTTPMYPSVDLVGGSVFDGINPGQLIESYTVSPTTGAITTITLTEPLAFDWIEGTSLTITTVGTTGVGYYLKFSSPVPLGKPVTVLHGFDQ
jgi:hypothetical protein